MAAKPIYQTRHAVQRALRYDLSPEAVEKIIREGRRRSEGKTKTRYMLHSKRSTLVAICEEYSDQIIVLTITRGGEKGK